MTMAAADWPSYHLKQAKFVGSWPSVDGIGALASTCRAIRSGSPKNFAGALKPRSTDNFSEPSSTQRGTTETCRTCIRTIETHFLKSKAATRFSMNQWFAGIVFARSKFTGRRGRRCMRIKACRP